MFTINSIIKEINDLPAERLEEVYEYIHTLKTTSKKAKNTRKKILSFAGSFNDMSDEEYKTYKRHTKTVRKKLFGRDITI